MNHSVKTANLLELFRALDKGMSGVAVQTPVYSNLSDDEAVKTLLARAKALVAFRLRDEEEQEAA